TYVIAGLVPKASVPDALVWDTCDPYHYVRIQPLSESEDLIILGGEDHHTGEASDMDQRLANLQQWTRKRYPSFTTAKYRWSGQVMEPIDFMPFSGRNPGSRNTYVHTGDSDQASLLQGRRRKDHPPIGNMHAHGLRGSLEHIRKVLGLSLPWVALRPRWTGAQRSRPEGVGGNLIIRLLA